MAKLSECYVYECEGCYEKSIIIEPARNGDTVDDEHTDDEQERCRELLSLVGHRDWGWFVKV